MLRFTAKNRLKSRLKAGGARNLLKGGFYRSQSETADARNRLTGGFYPSAMGSILTTGPVFMGAAMFQARRLLANNTKRMASRSRSGKPSGPTGRSASRSRSGKPSGPTGRSASRSRSGNRRATRGITKRKSKRT